MVKSRVRARPRRSVRNPKRIPPVAHPMSSVAVIAPVTALTRGSPGATPSSRGTQTGATKLKRSPSNTSKPQPSQAAKRTTHW
jgi:hypothetical protein